MKTKTILITGGTEGIGKAAVILLAKMGARIVFTGRNETKAKKVLAESLEISGNSNISYLIGDLSIIEEVKKLADEFRAGNNRLDILINNAGGYFSKRVISADGFEYTYALNHLAYFQLTLRLIDLLKKSSPSRIINVSSEAHRGGIIDFDNLRGEKKYVGFKAYSQSKLANLLFTYELHRRIAGQGITVNAMHPGVVRTGFGKNNPGAVKAFVKMFAPFLRSPEKGAETAVYLAASDEVKEVSGKYFFNSREMRSNQISYDEGIARRLWDISLEQVGMKGFEI